MTDTNNFKINFSALLVLLFVSVKLFSQVSEIKNIKAIKESPEYIYGYAGNEDPEVAEKNALEDLLTKISVRVESSFELTAEESTSEGFKEYSKSVIKTYSDASLTNVKKISYEKRNVYYVLRYLTKTDLQKAFDLRKDKIISYLDVGTKAQKELRIADALRNYYYAYVLYLSHPYQNELKINENGKEELIGILLRDRINQILTLIDFEPTSIIPDKKDDKSRLILSCTYDGQKVENLDYKFHNGKSLSNLNQVLNGTTEIMLYGAEQSELNKINIYIEYKNSNRAIYDKELNRVLNVVKTSAFPNRKTIKVPRKIDKITKTKHIIEPKFESINILNKDKKYYFNTTNDLLQYIVNKDYNSAYQILTPEGKDMFDKLIKYGRVSIPPLKDTLRFIEINDDIIVRSVPMTFYFPNSKKRFMENVVFTFDKVSRKINSVSFAISDRTMHDIVNHSERFGTIEDKYTIIKFMEAYKTAYSLKRLKYIESIFSDDALIIVGTVLQRSKPIDGMYEQIGEKEVKYQRYSKKEYIKRLANVFNSKDYINLNFDEATVNKVNGEQKIYGIQIAQSYNSDNYSDFGYLFLMIDLTDTLEHPQIYVRTWQPQKSSDGSIYGLEDFKLN